MEVKSTSARRSVRVCESCRAEFQRKRRNQRYCSSKCRYARANNVKGAARKAIIERHKNRCSVSGCRWRSRKGVLYVHAVNGATAVLCGLHHAAIYRPDSRREPGPLIGRYYYGYFHVSLEEADLEGRAFSDGGIEQLIDHLSEETDAYGERVPHPLEWDRTERVVYMTPPFDWEVPDESV